MAYLLIFGLVLSGVAVMIALALATDAPARPDGGGEDDERGDW